MLPRFREVRLRWTPAQGGKSCFSSPGSPEPGKAAPSQPQLSRLLRDGDEVPGGLCEHWTGGGEACARRGGVAWSGTSPRAQGWGHEATAEPCWGRLPCAGRGERARKAAPRPRLRLRGLANASVAWFSAAQPPGSPTLARRVPAHTRTLHSATHRHTYTLAWPHPRDAHLPAGSHSCARTRTQDWSRPHAASRAGWAARSLLRLRTHRGSRVLFHTRTHTRIPTDSITLLSSLSRTWLATLHLAQASAGQRPSPGAARGQTQQVPAAL